MKKSLLSLYLTAAFIYMGDAHASDPVANEEVRLSPPSRRAEVVAMNDLEAVSIETARSGWHQTLVDFLERYSLTTPTKEDYRSLGTLVQLFRDQDDFKGMISTLGWVERLYVQMNENGTSLPLVNLLPKPEQDLRFEFHLEKVKCRDAMWRNMMEAEKQIFRAKRPKKQGQDEAAATLEAADVPFKKNHPRDQLFIWMCANGLDDALERLVATYSQDIEGEDQLSALLDEQFITDEPAIRGAMLESLGSAFVVHNISAQNKSLISLASLLRFSSIDLAKALDAQIALRQASILQYLKERAVERFQRQVNVRTALGLAAEPDKGTLKIHLDEEQLEAILAVTPNSNQSTNDAGGAPDQSAGAGSTPGNVIEGEAGEGSGQSDTGGVENKGSADDKQPVDADVAGIVVTETKDGAGSGDEEASENTDKGAGGAGEFTMEKLDEGKGSSDSVVKKSKGGMLKKLQGLAKRGKAEEKK